jgi:hypothetical protein
MLALGLGSAAVAAQEQPAPTAPTVVSLEYREVTSSILNLGLSIDTQTKPFAKEPASDPQGVVRGVFRFDGGTNQSLGFLWHFTKGKLYLDLNRNGDLTDDAQGVFNSSSRPRNDSYQTFTNVHLSFSGPAGSRPALVDLNLYRYGPRPNGTVTLRSFWEGKMTLQGRDWQVGVVESLSLFARGSALDGSYLVLRPWAAHNQPLELDPQNGSLDGFGFGRNLFLDEQAYAVNCAFEPQNGAVRGKLELTPRQASLGELKLTGKYINRLVLTGQGKDAFTVVLNRPAETVRIPVGSYSNWRLQLKAGTGEATREFNRYGTPDQSTALVINPTKAATLAAGGPLTNTVTADRQGRYLSLGYKLVGADGAEYQLLHQDRSQPPQFVVSKDGKQLASEKFEYG